MGGHYLAESLRPNSYVATDFATRALAYAPRGENFSTRAMDVYDLATVFDAESVDVVLGVEVCFYLTRVNEFVAAASRVLRPGGLLVLAEQPGPLKLDEIVETALMNDLVIDVFSNLDKRVKMSKRWDMRQDPKSSYYHIVARKAPEAAQAQWDAVRERGQTETVDYFTHLHVIRILHGSHSMQNVEKPFLK